MYFGGIFPVHTVTSTLLPLYHQSELMQYSDIIVEGILVSNSTHVKWEQSGNVVVPEIYTNWTLKSIDIIKGDLFDTIVFKTDGGKYNNMVQIDFESTPLNQGEHILVYLSRTDMDSIYKGSYIITGQENGKFIIDSSNTARNDYRDKTIGLEDLKRELRQLVGT